MQPPINPEMFIRQETLYIGTRLNYESATLSLKTVIPTLDDLKVIHNLNRLDHYIIRSADYDKYVELLWDVQHGCLERFHLWLTNKGLKEYQDRFVNLAEVFLSFIYDYEHKEPVTLKSSAGRYFEEFMMDYLFRETSMKPWEYTLCTSSIKLFYKFLYEKGYLLKPPDPLIVLIDRLEPYYLDILRQRFS